MNEDCVKDPEQEQSEVDNLRAGLFIRLCFESRTIAHIAHFATRNEAQHEAFNTFYDNIVPLTDRFGECYIGKFGPINKFPLVQMPLETPTMFFQAVRSWIESCRASLGDAPLQSLVDDIINEFNELVYKLENLS